MITNMMYNDEFGFFVFDVSDPPDFEKWGHFSQMVWKDTTHVACVTFDCQGLVNANPDPTVTTPHTVCNYSPPGKYLSLFSTLGSCMLIG